MRRSAGILSRVIKSHTLGINVAIATNLSRLPLLIAHGSVRLGARPSGVSVGKRGSHVRMEARHFFTCDGAQIETAAPASVRAKIEMLTTCIWSENDKWLLGRDTLGVTMRGSRAKHAPEADRGGPF